MRSLPSEPRWITAEEITWINARIVAETGEVHRVRDPGLLESAASRPRNRWELAGEEDILRLAASLLFGVVKNHAFEQGNKRTGAVAALMFLEANGYRWVLEDHGEFATWVLGLVDGDVSEDDFAERMRPNVQ